MIAEFLPGHCRRLLLPALALLLGLAVPGAAAPGPMAPQPSLRYTLAMPAPQTHYFEVMMNLRNFGQDYTDVKMPVWAPGSYLVREFARHVEGLQAQTAGGQPLAVEKINKNTWRVRHPKQADFRVSYRVYAFELSVRTSFVDADHGYLNGSSVFLYPALNKALASTVAVQLPAGWAQVSTALRPVAGQKFTYAAASYDELADSPFEIGNHKLLTFTANGTPHQVAMYGTYQVDEPRLLADMQKVCEAAHRVVAKNPLDHYLFIVHNLERGGGGLEHLYSTTLEVGRTAYGTEAGYKSFLGLVAHEYFHLWNVKRIRPVALGPFDYDRENYTHMLWVSEGMTEYMANLLTLRAGFYRQDEYLNALAGQISAVENTPGNRQQPVSEASFDAWIRFYRANENSPNSQISYYDKGEVVGAVLDLMIIEATQGTKHLDDVFRRLYDQYYLGLKRGFTDAEYQDAVASVAGRRFDDFFQKCVYGTQTLDYATALGYAGLGLSATPLTDKGDLGAAVSVRGGKLVATSVKRDGSAWVGGLNVNDELLQIDGQPANEEATKQLANRPVGTEVRLQVRRDGLPRELTLQLLPTPDRRYQLTPLPNATPAQLAARSKWLGSDH